MSTTVIEQSSSQPNGPQLRELRTMMTNGTKTTTKTTAPIKTNHGKQCFKQKHHQQHHHEKLGAAWKVKASAGALNTSNPIREIIETMNLAENPQKKVIPLSIGDPTIFGNLKPCKEILDAIEKANNCGKYYGYQIAAGMEAARDAVADYHFKCTGNRIKRQDVILASGCSHAIDLSICVLAQHGQNILIPRPGFPLYKTLTSVYGVEFKQYDLLADQNWSIDLEHLESLIDDRTAAIVINNPSNPCGSVFSRRHLKQILKLAERHRLPIIADEIYDKFIFSPELYEQQQQQQDNKPASRPTSKWEQSTNGRRKQSLKLGAKVHHVNGLSNGHSNGDQSDDLENIKPEEEEEDGDEEKNQSLEATERDFEESWEELGDDGQEEEEDTEEDQEEAEAEQQRDGGFHYVPFRSLSSLSEVVPILTCGGISKTCLIPGLRLGWIIINDKQNVFDSSIRNGLNRLTQRLMGPNSLVQGALSDILTSVPESFYKQTMDFIFKNAKLCYDRLKLVRGLHPYMPQGSMYLMVKFEEQLFPRIKGDLDFTSKLMNEESVLVLPGKCFDFPNYFRICLTVPTNVMEEALVRIEEFCQRHLDERAAADLAAGAESKRAQLVTVVEDEQDDDHKQQASRHNHHHHHDITTSRNTLEAKRTSNANKLSLPHTLSNQAADLTGLPSSNHILSSNNQHQHQQQQQSGKCT